MSGLLDELARGLARSQTRRSALKTIGGVLGAALVPALGASRALAATETTSRSDCSKTCSGGTFTQVCNCHAVYPPTAPAGICNHCCCAPGDTCCCPPKACVCCPSGYSCGGTGCVCNDDCGGSCCRANQECLRGQGITRCIDKCDDGQTRCGQEECCDKNEECVRARIGSGTQSICVKRCPEGQARCGEGACCPKGLKCIDPAKHTCAPCEKNEMKCGKRCCSKRDTCCDAKKGLCCKPSEKCGSWPPDKHICCKFHSCQSRPGASPTCCANANELCLGEHTSGGAIVPNQSKKTCCPPERQTRNAPGGTAIGCCPAGMVAAPGGKFIIGNGLTGFCCPPTSLCGSGDDATCCPTGHSCCNGTCRDLTADPANCGSCGHPCTSNAVCRNGQCAIV